MENLLQLAVPLVIGVAIGYFLFKKLNDGTTGSHPPSVDPGDVGEPHGVITVAEAIALHKNYKSSRYNLINETIGNGDPDFKDTQFVWFSYEKMRKYMRYLEVIQKKNKRNKPISGIRVYFGAHDANGGYDGNKLYANQQTVFFTPTIEVNISQDYGNMKNLPFSIIPDNPKKPLVGRYKIIRELLIEEHEKDKRYNAAVISLNADLENVDNKNMNLVQKSAENEGGNAENGGNGTSTSFNMGELSPPPPKK